MAVRVDPIETQFHSSDMETWASSMVEQAHERAVRATVGEMATFLQHLIGQKLTAVVAGVGDPKAVGRWARGERDPRAEAERRLREAYQVATLLTLAESEQTARSWFLGMNPYLGDRAPMTIFAQDPEGGARAMRAARAFLAHG